VFGNAHNGYVYVALLTSTVLLAAQHLTKYATLDRQAAYAPHAVTSKGFSIFIYFTVQDSGQWCIEQRDI
jgi:hypothetical protein